MRSILLGLALAISGAALLFACTREDGLPDPPLRTLVPCLADAAADDPLTCPAPAIPDGGDASPD